MMMGHFATMVLVCIDSSRQQLVYANAGHELPFIRCGDGPVARLDHSDLILGVEESMVYEGHSLPVGRGTKIVLVSDGITEAFNANEDPFGIERVERVVSLGADESTEALVQRLADELHKFRDGRAAFDDTTLLVAQIV